MRWRAAVSWLPGQFALWAGCVGVSLGGLGAAQGAALTTNRPPLAVWDVLMRAEVGGGYRDNVLLASTAPENSPFVSMAMDASFIRLSETGSELTLFLMGQNRQYTDAPSVNEEWFASGTAQVARPITARDRLGLEFQYLYQKQVLDVSETQGDQNRVLVKGHSFTLRPKWTHTLWEGWEGRLEAIGQCQRYEGELDDFWEVGGKASLARLYGRRSEVSLNFQSVHWLYDDREQADSDGNDVSGTRLRFWRPEVFGLWRHNWDEQRRWTTTTKLGWLYNQDNGSGYYDYNRLQLSQRVRWRQAGWEVAAGARFGWYFYSVQKAGSEYRERSYATLDLRVERRLGKHWYVYAAVEGDWNESNDPADEYNDWLAGAGVGVEF